MPRPPTNTRQKLLAAGLDLIWQSSYGSVSVDEICAAADVNKGSFYHYFKSKAGLAAAAMDAYWEEERIKLDRIFSPTVPPLERFQKLADHIISITKENKRKYNHVVGCPFNSLGSEVIVEEEELRFKCDTISRFHRNYVLSAIRDAIADKCIPDTTNIDARTEQIHCYILGTMLVARVENDHTKLERDLSAGIFALLKAG